MSKTHAPLWWLPWGDDGVDRGGSSGCNDDDDDVKMVVGVGCGGDRGGGGSAWRRVQRFGGNEATKKTQKTLLKKMYETFNASSSESLDSIFNRLQKIGMHVVVWRNKSDLGSISFDDLYNNFKIVELTACLSDAIVYAYLATQPNGSQVVHEDLEQIHEDDLDEMDLKWQLALLNSSRKTSECGRIFFQAMLAIDETGFNWSYMADEGRASSNFAFMVFLWILWMVQKPVLNNVKKGTGQREVRPVWNNAMRDPQSSKKIYNLDRNFAPQRFNQVQLVPFEMLGKAFQELQHQLVLLGQTTTGKESSNPFMGGSLPKTISPMIHLSQKFTHLEVERTSKESHAQTLTMLMKKAKDWGRQVKLGFQMQKSYFEFQRSCQTEEDGINRKDAEWCILTNFKGMNYEQVIFEKSTGSLCLVFNTLEAKDSDVCKITRAYGSSSFHGDIHALLRRLDRQDLSQLYSLVQERFKDYPLEGHDLDLWGDLRMIFDLNEEDDMVESTILEDYERGNCMNYNGPLWWLPWGDDGVDRGGSSGCDDDDDDDVKMVVGAGCGGDRGGGGSALSWGTNDGVAASLQLSQIHNHMLMLKLQRHTISIKIQESRKLKFKDKDFRNSDFQDLP
ncbi:hypothetical protein Tco_0758199 [Tanacetum coccineum]